VSHKHFYVLAGRTAQRGNLTVAERYVPSRHRWERVPDLKRERGGTAATTLSDGRIVIAGGEEAAGTIKQVEIYDPRTRRWGRLANMPTPRHGLGVVSRGRTVYTVQGGPRPGFAFSNRIEALKVP
jgi:N-acetylneuraminic acid mutarotase